MPRYVSKSQGKNHGLCYHAYTIWLITRNDLKSIVLPETAFGIFSALAGPLLTTNENPNTVDVLLRLPSVVLWNWLNVLLFDIANQRLPASILEDSVNKPWRALPSGRITEREARWMLLTLIPITFLATLWLGGISETVVMMVLTWMYNDLGGADELYVVRNLINALGFMCYSSGATTVAAGFGRHSLTLDAYVWIAIVGGIVFSTLSMQDLPDVEGDAARGRSTAPLLHGDAIARWTIAMPVLAWSVICPWFWDLSWSGYAISIIVGNLLALRILFLRSIIADRGSWNLWCFWTIILYTLPLLKYNQI